MATEKRVDLGFVNDDCDPRLLESRYFPSKVGGKPAWLSLNPIPPTDRLTCSNCSSQLVFLLQVYSPRDEQADAFHRTVFLFVCRNPACCTPNNAVNFTVFRSQLPHVNQFFSADPPPDDPSEADVGTNPSASKYQSLCVVCGCVGTKTCSQCHSVNYCGKEHQSRHWKAGHKKTCGKQVSQGSGDYKYI